MIDEKLYIPLHIQLSKKLEEQIMTGKYENKIPSERELMDMYSVSRTTVREAVTRLVDEGLLKKIHGKGTFVNEKPPIQEWLSSLNSFTDTVKKMGKVPGSKLLISTKISKEDHSIDIFSEDVYLIERLRYADKNPVAIESHFYPVEIGEKLSAFNLEEETIYDLLEGELDIILDEAEQYITTKKVEDSLADYLEIPKGSNVLIAERTIVDNKGKVVEFYVGQYRPDMYTFRLKTKRNNNKK